jgi:hypothetical protein
LLSQLPGMKNQAIITNYWLEKQRQQIPPPPNYHVVEF